MIVVSDMRDGYRSILHHVLRVGDRVAPRGLQTIEITDEVIRVDDVRDTLPIGIGRRLNLAIAAVEAAQFVGGFVDPALMCRISPEFRRFLEEDGTFWGGYGERVGAQLLHAAQKLTHDRDTRQAVLTLWDVKRDNVPGKKDYPCTLSMWWRIRQDKLDLSVTMRSNDAVLGLGYDVFVFTQAQLTLAGALGIEPGRYYHHPLSLHVYVHDLELIDSLTPATKKPVLPEGFGRPGATSVFGCVTRARKIGQGREDEVKKITKSEQWYVDKLEPHRA